jgi:alpha-galactosidase
MAVGTPTALTPDEQYAYMSMWCLMAAPLIFSGDMAKLDPFTLNVLCNHEVIAVDQDPLGKQARIIRHSEEEFILLKEMMDGSLSLGLFNLKNEKATMEVSFDEIGLTGKQLFRDLWRQIDMGVFENKFGADITPHGVSMVRIWSQH